MTAAKVRLAMAAMGQKETKVTDLCSELAITRQFQSWPKPIAQWMPTPGIGYAGGCATNTKEKEKALYRHVAPDGTLRKDGVKVVEVEG